MTPLPHILRSNEGTPSGILNVTRAPVGSGPSRARRGGRRPQGRLSRHNTRRTAASVSARAVTRILAHRIRPCAPDADALRATGGTWQPTEQCTLCTQKHSSSPCSGATTPGREQHLGSKRCFSAPRNSDATRFPPARLECWGALARGRGATLGCFNALKLPGGRGSLPDPSRSDARIYHSILIPPGHCVPQGRRDERWPEA